MYVDLNFVTVEQANLLKESILSIGGLLPENKVLILSPKNQDAKVGSIILPGTSENMPKKGVIIMRGEITEENITYRPITKEGRIITFGLYAGKEVFFPDNLVPLELKPILEKQVFTVLSLTEIVFTESNLK